MSNIADKKNLKLNEKALDALYECSEGDLRKAINTLQISASHVSEITDDVIYQTQGYINPREIKALILECLKSKPDFQMVSEKVQDMMEKYGVFGHDLVKSLSREINKASCETGSSIHVIGNRISY